MNDRFKKRCLYARCARHFEGSALEHYCSTKCKSSAVYGHVVVPEKSKKSLRGSNDYSKDSFFRQKIWKDLRFRVLRKYGYCCLACGRKPPMVTLHVDHIKPRVKYPDLALEFNNLQVLCYDCNVGKGYAFEDDLRPKGN